MAYKQISTVDLHDRIERDEDMVLINVLEPEQFETAHIPGSINIPVSSDDFENRVEDAAGGKDRPIVVYCASTACDASAKAAEKLDEAGFSNVDDYEDGTKAWKEAGHDVESEVPASK